MRRALVCLVFIAGGVGWWLWQTSSTPAAGARTLAFVSPYPPAQPLETYLVFTAAPRADVPDGQIHWTDQEVPGIDVAGPDGLVRNMCPADGLAWTLAGGDPYGGGTFVAIECQGRAAGWQMLAFHLASANIPPSASSEQRQYTRVASGASVGQESDHTHLSLGYWADARAQQAWPCPQWYVQGRYWVNAACLVETTGLPLGLTRHLNPGVDAELKWLAPDILNPLKQLALFAVSVGLVVYVALALWRTLLGSPEPGQKFSPVFDASLKSGLWFGFLIMLILLSAGPVWPISLAQPRRFTAEAQRYQALAERVGYGDVELLAAFYRAAVPRRADGQRARPGEPGKIFPPEAAAAIPFGETDAAPWGEVDPTVPGIYGQSPAWEVVAERWPPTLYERLILGLTVSHEAQRQREGLTAIANSPALQALGARLGKTIRAQDLYGSTAGAVGRTQILPGHFASGGICSNMVSLDMWNDVNAVAECTTRYLTVNGCWGSWWANGEVWSALCGYNPGAWNQSEHRWYWAVLQDRLTRLTAARAALDLSTTSAIITASETVTGTEYVSTPVLGLLITQAALQDGYSAYLPPAVTDGLEQVGFTADRQQTSVRVGYRIFRAWTLLYYSPETLAALGIEF